MNILFVIFKTLTRQSTKKFKNSDTFLNFKHYVFKSSNNESMLFCILKSSMR